MHKGILAARLATAQQRISTAVGDLEYLADLTPPEPDRVPTSDPAVRRLFQLEYLADRLEVLASAARLASLKPAADDTADADAPAAVKGKGK